jgi:hypothetical protein
MSTTNETWSIPFREIFLCVWMNEYDTSYWWGGTDRGRQGYLEIKPITVSVCPSRIPLLTSFGGRNSFLGLRNRLPTAWAAVRLQNHEFWNLYTDLAVLKCWRLIRHTDLESTYCSGEHTLPDMSFAGLNILMIIYCLCKIRLTHHTYTFGRVI